MQEGAPLAESSAATPLFVAGCLAPHCAALHAPAPLRSASPILPAGRHTDSLQELQFPGDNFRSGFWPAFWLMVRLQPARRRRMLLPLIR